MMPLRSENSPPMAHRISGVATRKVAAASEEEERQRVVHHDRLNANSACSHGRGSCTSAPENRITRPWISTTISRVMLGDLEGELGAALLQGAEQQRRQHDAQRMVAAHQGDGDAGEAVARREVEHDAMVHAHQLVDADEARQRAAEAHRQHGHAAQVGAGIDRGLGIVAHGAQRIAPRRVPQEHPDGDAAGERQQQRQVERRCRPCCRQEAPTAAKPRLCGVIEPGAISTFTIR